jgi:hypothetical protein
MKPALLLALVVFLAAVAQAVGVPTADHGWISWQCDGPGTPPGCQLVRLSAAGRVEASVPAGESNVFHRLVTSPDGATVYLVGPRLTAYDARTLQPRWSVNGGPPVQHISAAVLPDGRLAVGAARGAVDLRDAATGRRRGTLAHPGLPPPDNDDDDYRQVTALAADPSGRWLAIGSRGGGVRLRDLATGQERQLSGRCGRSRPTAHRGPVSGLVWTGPTTLVSAANDETVQRWNTARGRSTGCRSVPGAARALLALPGDRLLAIGATRAVLLAGSTFQRLAQLGPLAGQIRSWRVLKNVLTLDDGLRARHWDTRGGQETGLGGAPFARLAGTGWTVVVGPDLRVRLTQGGQVQPLQPLALPPLNLTGEGWPERWTVTREGEVLTVSATASVRTMIMGTEEVSTVYRWQRTTGRFLDCRTVFTSGSGADRGCLAASAPP